IFGTGCWRCAAGPLVAPATGTRDRVGYHRYARGGHHFAESSYGIWRRFEVAEAVALRDAEGGPAVGVLSVPDFDLRALLRQEQHGRGRVFVGRAVHRRLAVLVDCVHRD